MAAVMMVPDFSWKSRSQCFSSIFPMNLPSISSRTLWGHVHAVAAIAAAHNVSMYPDDSIVMVSWRISPMTINACEINTQHSRVKCFVILWWRRGRWTKSPQKYVPSNCVDRNYLWNAFTQTEKKWKLRMKWIGCDTELVKHIRRQIFIVTENRK